MTTRSRRSAVPTLVLRVAGIVLLAVGAVGAVLPVLPTTVFWIAAAACFARSSPRLYGWLLRRRSGRAIEAYLKDGVIDARSKRVALAGMAFGAGCVWLAPLGIGWQAAATAVIAASALYVASRPSGSPVRSEADAATRVVS